MSDSKYSNLGSEISDMVQKAIDSQDFSQLSTTIQNSVSQVANIVADTVASSVVDEPQKDHRPDYMKNAQHKMEAAQNPWKSAVKSVPEMAETTAVSERGLYSPGGSGRLKGYFLFTLGLAGILGCAAGLLTLAIASKITGVSLMAPEVILLIGAVGFGGMSIKGSGTLKQIRKFKNYVKKIGKRDHISIEELSSASGRNEKEVLKDIQDMLQENMFLQGHLDQESKTLYVTDQGYQIFLREKNRRLEQQNREKEEQARIERETQELPPEVRKLIADGNVYIEKIHRSNDAISDETVSRKLYDLEAVTRKIFDYVKTHPQCADDTKKLMKYYLPTTIKLLDSYEKLTEEELSGQHPDQLTNIAKSKKEIEDTLDTLNLAFAKLFDNLYQDTSMDITADISVLHTLLAQEGLTGEEIRDAMKGIK